MYCSYVLAARAPAAANRPKCQRPMEVSLKIRNNNNGVKCNDNFVNFFSGSVSPREGAACLRLSAASRRDYI